MVSVCPHGCIGKFIHVHTAKWIKGDKGQSCDQVCQAQGLECDANKQSELTSNAAVSSAFKEAGYDCKGFHGARSYAGTPFSTGRDDDCAPIKMGATSVCHHNNVRDHSALCYCGSMFVCIYG